MKFLQTEWYNDKIEKHIGNMPCQITAQHI